MDLDTFRKARSGSEEFRETAEKQLENLNSFIKAEHSRQQVPEDKIPVITEEIFDSLRMEKTYETVARETPRQVGMRRRELVKGLGMTILAGGLAAKAGAMIAGVLFKERLSELAVKAEDLEKHDDKDLEDRAKQIAEIIMPSAILAAIPTMHLAGRSVLNNQQMLEEINRSRTNFALVMFSIVFNLQPDEILTMTDAEIEEKLRALKKAGCGLEEMIDQRLYASLAKYMKEDKEGKGTDNA